MILRTVEQCLVDTLHRYPLSPSSQNLVRGLWEKLRRLHLEIVVCGAGNTGKTAILNALTRGKFGQSAATQGTTLSPQTYTWQHPARQFQLTLVDTPSWEVDTDNGSLREMLDTADLVLWVITPQITASDRQLWQAIQHKPLMIVCNKTDLYPICDRHSIANQLDSLGISATQEQIVLVSADPLPDIVRVGKQQYWELVAPQLRELENQLSQIIHQRAEQMIAQNILSILVRIQRHSLSSTPPPVPCLRSWCCRVFLVEAFCLLISPTLWLDTLLAGLIHTWAILRWAKFYPYTPLATWQVALGAIALNSCLLGCLHILAVWHTAQILWVGISILWLMYELDERLRQSSIAHDLLQIYLKKGELGVWAQPPLEPSCKNLAQPL